MAGRAYRPADLLEISWRDLQWTEIQRRASASQREELPVREEVVEDDAGVISSVIVPTLVPAPEDTMECQEHGIFRTFSLLFFATFYVVLPPPRSFLLVSLFQEKIKMRAIDPMT